MPEESDEGAGASELKDRGSEPERRCLEERDDGEGESEGWRWERRWDEAE